MPPLVKNFFHRPALRFEMASNPRWGKFRDPRFVSFIAESNRKTINTDFRDFLLMLRKVARYSAVLGVACLCGWVLLESARALSIF